MAFTDNKEALKSIRQRNYLARDFDGFRRVLLEYARQYYPDRIKDFSEASLGGLFLDMAAYVGDNLSFYLDHLYGELNPDTAVETKNIEQALRNAGVKIVGAAPALVSVDFYIEVSVLDDLAPDPTLLPTIQAGTIVKADNGTVYILIEDVEFWRINTDTASTELNPDVEITNGRRINNNIVTKILKKTGLCSSGVQAVESTQIGTFTPFKRVTLQSPDVTSIISVTDSNGNIYYEVEALTHDVVYQNTVNITQHDVYAKDSLKVIPAPYRYLSRTSLDDRTTTLVFGGGTADSLDDDAIPDPSEFAIPLRYKQTFSRRAVNPQRLLQTTTLGVGPQNAVLTIMYRHGGGLSHNVQVGTIRSIVTSNVIFPENPDFSLQKQVRTSLEVFNPSPASGGEDAPSSDELLAILPMLKNSQERIVTKEDLLARVYTMPSNFGRVFRASVSSNPNNPLASRLHVISRSPEGRLIQSSDALKINLKRYLNSYRMISDAIDLLDAEVINLEIYFQIIADPSYNKTTLLKGLIKSIQNQFNIKNMHINQPIVKSDITTTILAHAGVIAVDNVTVSNLYGIVKNRQYSTSTFDVKSNTRNQIIYAPSGGIFEIRYPEANIIGKVISNV